MSKRTVRKYEGMLGVKFKEECPEFGKYNKKSIGLRKWVDIGFWKIVNGRVSGVENKKYLGEVNQI